MKRSMIETLLGGLVIVIAVYFLVFSYKTADVAPGGGYEVSADFSSIGGLKVGDPVQVSGVKVGAVKQVELMSDTYLARVTVDIDPSIKLPTDTTALISSESLLGGRYLALEPGGEEELIPQGGQITYTQAPQNLEQLLGQFIFNSQKQGGDEEEEEAKSASAAPAVSTPAPVTEPMNSETPKSKQSGNAPEAASQAAPSPTPDNAPVNTQPPAEAPQESIVPAEPAAGQEAPADAAQP